MLNTTKSKLALAVVFSLGLSACGGSSSSNSTPTPTPPPANTAPTDIALSANTVAENTAGVTLGTLSATDADSGDTFTFAVSDDKFVVEGTELKLAAATSFDFEALTEYKFDTEANVDVDVTVTDSSSNTFTKTLTISVTDVLDYYDFQSKNVAGESAVSYTGQVARQLLINDLNSIISSNFGDIQEFETAANYTSKVEAYDDLIKYFDGAGNDAEWDVFAQATPILTTTTPAAQTNYLDITSSSKNLIGKIAGNDNKVGDQHKNWNTGDFAGWQGESSPTNLVLAYLDMLATNAETQINGSTRQDPFGNDISKVYLTNDGRDLKQLTQKFLLMAVAYSQGTDDYLDDANESDGKGLYASHDLAGDDKYTSLEHQWDEGFGYFGAARDYLSYTDEELAKKGGRDDYQLYHDTNGDGAIDFGAEYNFGQSVNAAKRDLGAKEATDFTAEAMNAFLMGRKLLNDTAGNALTDEQRTELNGYRDTAVLAWEKAISATVVHYINDSIADLEDIVGGDTTAGKYEDLAKHWSELKGFALGLQFNPRSQVSDAKFVEFHQLVGDKPADLTDNDAINAYIEDLKAARVILQEAYNFSEANTLGW